MNISTPFIDKICFVAYSTISNSRRPTCAPNFSRPYHPKIQTYEAFLKEEQLRDIEEDGERGMERNGARRFEKLSE
ncbi:hypothetical protein LIER_12475 [Lithospermum erythrorhizon]|uniref:Uncharacterized protein n=1 Tax=Lithospermum erythrorhizon TaxID=34254 RepID=A0AAV3PUC0_LITER